MQKQNCMVRTPTAAKAEATTQKHNCKVRTPSAAKTEATIQTEHTTHKHYIFIRCHFGPMLVFPSWIGVRTFHVSIAVRCFVVFWAITASRSSLELGRDLLRYHAHSSVPVQRIRCSATRRKYFRHRSRLDNVCSSRNEPTLVLQRANRD